MASAKGSDGKLDPRELLDIDFLQRMEAIGHYAVDQQGLVNLISSARSGLSSAALKNVLEVLFFRANSLKIANPQMALQIYNEAKSANPSLKIYDEEEDVRILKMAVEAGEFDAEEFMKKYAIKEPDPSQDGDLYFVWSIAEEASKGKFGKPDARLILQLVSRGGFAPAELKLAVEKVYKNWKSGVTEEFNICDHITSSAGGIFCAARDQDKHDKEILTKLQTISQSLSTEIRPILEKAYHSSNEFIEIKAANEEQHGGTLRVASIIDSVTEQQNDYLELISKVLNGFKPQFTKSLQEIDSELNLTYARALEKVKERLSNDSSGGDGLSVEGVIDAQRVWIKFRDDNSGLFAALNPSITNEEWKAWLTELRNSQLKALIKRCDDWS